MTRLIRWSVGAASLLFIGRAQAQCSWVRVHTEQPNWAQGSSMVYDAARGRCVTLGPYPSYPVFEWDGSLWRVNYPVNRWDGNASPQRSGPMAYDSARSRAVLVPSSSGSGAPGWTWAFNGAR